MEEHVEARLAGVLAHDVGGRQVEQRGAQLSADRVQQHRLAAALHQSETRVGVTCRPADQSQLTSGPTISTDLIAGVFSRSSGEPSGRMQYYREIYLKIFSIVNKNICTSVMSRLTSAGPGLGSTPRDLSSAPRYEMLPIYSFKLTWRVSIQVIVLHLSRSHLGVWFDDIVHDKFLKQRLRGSVRSQILVFLLFPLLASLLALLLFLTNFTLFSFVSFHSLKK